MNAEHGEENVQVKPHAYVHRRQQQQCMQYMYLYNATTPTAVQFQSS